MDEFIRERASRIAKGLVWILYAGLVPVIVGGSKSAHAYPSGIHWVHEGSIGLETGVRRFDLNVAGVSGASAARANVPVRMLYLGAIGGFGVSESLDASLRIGGVLPKGPWSDERAEAEAKGTFAGGFLVRGSLWSSRILEIGLYADVNYIPGLSYRETFVVGNLGVPGSVSVENIFTAETGTGFTFWLTAGKTYVVPFVQAYLQPAIAGKVSVRQEGMSTIRLGDVTTGQDRMVGVGAGVGIAHPRVIVTPEIRMAPISGGVSVIFPFGGADAASVSMPE